MFLSIPVILTRMFDLVSFIKTAGYLGVGGVVFAESGLLVGFFLPGDSLLFTAGFLASQGYLDVVTLIFVTFVCAVIGDSVGYSFGVRVGPKIFTRDDSLFFDKKNVQRAHAFYEKHGGKAVTLARFMPVVRTFAPVVAGVGCMRYRTFLFYNVIGALAWAVGLPLVGYYAGALIPGVDRYIIPIVIGIILVSVSPAVYHIVRNADERARLVAHIKKHLFKK